MVIFSTPSSVSSAASSLTAPVLASTSQTLLTPRGLRTHTLPNALAHVDGAHPLDHQLVLGVGNLLRRQRLCLLILQFGCPPIDSTPSDNGLPGASVEGTEIL